MCILIFIKCAQSGVYNRVESIIYKAQLALHKSPLSFHTAS